MKERPSPHHREYMDVLLTDRSICKYYTTDRRFCQTLLNFEEAFL